jgi:Caspase domain
MAKGLSLHIGLNAVDPKKYSDRPGILTACEADAEDMQALAKKQGFTTVVRLTKAATRNRVLADLKSAASKLKTGDIFLLSYSGHGGQVPNTGNDFEPDGSDETWCLYDGELIDDELFSALAVFAAGVRIFVLSDSCHSGTVLRALGLARLEQHPPVREPCPAMWRFACTSITQISTTSFSLVLREILEPKPKQPGCLFPAARTTRRAPMVIVTASSPRRFSPSGEPGSSRTTTGPSQDDR